MDSGKSLKLGEVFFGWVFGLGAGVEGLGWVLGMMRAGRPRSRVVCLGWVFGLGAWVGCLGWVLGLGVWVDAGGTPTLPCWVLVADAGGTPTLPCWVLVADAGGTPTLLFLAFCQGCKVCSVGFLEVCLDVFNEGDQVA